MVVAGVFLVAASFRKVLFSSWAIDCTSIGELVHILFGQAPSSSVNLHRIFTLINKKGRRGKGGGGEGEGGKGERGERKGEGEGGRKVKMEAKDISTYSS